MADISKISVNNETYDIKDANARGSVSDLSASLGTLAFQNSASGSITPSGTVTAPTISVSPTTASVKVIKSVGSLPNWGANVSEETLSFSFNEGSLPVTNNQTVVTGIADATATAPIFTGTQTSVIVS